MQFTTLRRNSIKVAILCLSLFSTSAFALKDDTSQPLNIVSNEQLADFNNNKAIFVGEVVATQGSIEIHAQRAEITRNKNGELKEIIAYGKPTTYKQTQDNGKVINSRSSIMRYIPAENQIILIGKATIFQENSHVNGEKIVYNTVTKQLKATNGNAQNGRVQSTFVPNELKNKKED
ncbi:lipopolysaccharide transport periplasmic protein LptA [Succinivibrio sp.]|uniref:lipopolysaccharide transport periplasmic protein LptA n=1 Tax=Succinivibrio sp. TaxID=2053619 RepID=UPI00386497CD